MTHCFISGVTLAQILRNIRAQVRALYFHEKNVDDEKIELTTTIWMELKKVQKSANMFFSGGKPPDARSQTFAHIMPQQNVTQEIKQHKREINKQIQSGEAKAADFGEVTSRTGVILDLC